ncbi:hypothetical protein ACJX0J_007384, partial [Zea mays]
KVARRAQGAGMGTRGLFVTEISEGVSCLIFFLGVVLLPYADGRANKTTFKTGRIHSFMGQLHVQNFNYFEFNEKKLNLTLHLILLNYNVKFNFLLNSNRIYGQMATSDKNIFYSDWGFQIKPDAYTLSTLAQQSSVAVRKNYAVDSVDLHAVKHDGSDSRCYTALKEGAAPLFLCYPTVAIYQFMLILAEIPTLISFIWRILPYAGKKCLEQQIRYEIIFNRFTAPFFSIWSVGSQFKTTKSTFTSCDMHTILVDVTATCHSISLFNIDQLSIPLFNIDQLKGCRFIEILIFLTHKKSMTKIIPCMLPSTYVTGSTGIQTLAQLAGS